MSEADHKEDAVNYVVGGMRCGKTLVMENAKLKSEAEASAELVKQLREDLAVEGKRGVELEALLANEGRHCNTCEHFQVADDSYGESLGTVCVHEHGKACLAQDPDEGWPLSHWERRRLKSELAKDTTS